MTTLGDVRRLMARVLRKLERSVGREKMTADVARALIYGYAEIARVMKDLTVDELMRRMEQLEKRQTQAEQSAAAH